MTLKIFRITNKRLYGLYKLRKKVDRVMKLKVKKSNPGNLANLSFHQNHITFLDFSSIKRRGRKEN